MRRFDLLVVMRARRVALAQERNKRVEVARVVIVPTDATGVDACVKMKPLFRHIRSVYPNEWAASAGDELAAANAAIDLKEVTDPVTNERRFEENTLTVPPSVVAKWQAALIAARRRSRWGDRGT